MVNNGSRQVVEATVGVAEPGAGEVAQQVVAHVQPGQRKLNKGIHLGPGVQGPAEPRAGHTVTVSQFARKKTTPHLLI